MPASGAVARPGASVPDQRTGLPAATRARTSSRRVSNVATALATSGASASGTTSRSPVFPGVNVPAYSARWPRPPTSAIVSITAGTTAMPVQSTTMALSSPAAVMMPGPTPTNRAPTSRTSAPVMVPINGSIVRTRALVNRTGRPVSFAAISSKALLFQVTVSVPASVPVSVWVTLIVRSSGGSPGGAARSAWPRPRNATRLPFTQVSDTHPALSSPRPPSAHRARWPAYASRSGSGWCPPSVHRGR